MSTRDRAVPLVRALDVIRYEHHALAGVLTALRQLVRDIRERGARPDFEVLRAIVCYVHAFPERLHHPKESELLFPALRARSDEAAATLARLDAEHAQGDAAVARLAMALIEYEQLGAARLDAFADAVERYVDGYLRHMDVEEREVLPLASRVLTAEDWTTIDAAFAANRDPLTGHAPEAAFRALFTRIVNLVPAPLGLATPAH
jgi:hemerythrin-like domain-containing protein